MLYDSPFGKVYASLWCVYKQNVKRLCFVRWSSNSPGTQAGTELSIGMRAVCRCSSGQGSRGHLVPPWMYAAVQTSIPQKEKNQQKNPNNKQTQTTKKLNKENHYHKIKMKQNHKKNKKPPNQPNNQPNKKTTKKPQTIRKKTTTKENLTVIHAGTLRCIFSMLVINYLHCSAGALSSWEV